MKINLYWQCVAAMFCSISHAIGAQVVNYDFEAPQLNSGPDTFQLFEYGSSDVSISPYYAFRGSRSLHIRDYQRNQSFPEFQGYFPPLDRGSVTIEFALMTPDPHQQFNVAVAGAGHYRMVRDGMNFWLVNDGEYLRHMSDGIPKKLLRLGAYRWYQFRIDLNLGEGNYDLQIRDETGVDLINLVRQKNASNLAGSGINQYSFIGDLKDRSNADFFIDELVIQSYTSESPKPMIAPGRRELFIDKWQRFYRRIENPGHCFPVVVADDFVTEGDQQSLEELQENTELFKQLLSKPSLKELRSLTQSVVELGPEKGNRGVLAGVHAWAKGCAYLRARDFAAAVNEFETAQMKLGGAPATQFSLALAYAQTDHIYSAQSIIDYGRYLQPHDVRWAVLHSMVAFLANNSVSAEQVLAPLVQGIEMAKSDAEDLMQDAGWLFEPAVRKLRSEFVWDQRFEKYLVAEQYYFSLLWQQKYSDARRYADQFLDLLNQHDILSVLWEERAGDAALLAQRPALAKQHYQRVLSFENGRLSAMQKLADVYFLIGDFDDERHVREQIFGALNLE